MLDSASCFIYVLHVEKNGQQSRVRTARFHAGLSQADLASLVGVSRQAISAYEAGSMQPSVQVARRIADALGRSLDELYPSESIA